MIECVYLTCKNFKVICQDQGQISNLKKKLKKKGCYGCICVSLTHLVLIKFLKLSSVDNIIYYIPPPPPHYVYGYIGVSLLVCPSINTIWRERRKKGLSDVCVKCRFRSACEADLNNIFHFMYLFYLQQVYRSTKSYGVVKCRLGLACTNSAD